MMRAAVLTAPGRVELADIDLPSPGPDEVRIRLEGCGVCGSNLPPFEGRTWFTYPFAPGAPGHEGWGRVDAVGRNVRDLREGDRVAALSGHAYADYDVAPRGSVVKLPPVLEGRAFPGEALGCAVNVFRRSGVRAGQWVAVVGAGFLGTLLVQLARSAGARVIAFGRRRFALQLARDAGAEHTLPLSPRAEVLKAVQSLTAGAWCDVAIECAGAQEPLDLCGELLRHRGRLVIAGYHQDSPRPVNLQLWNWRGLDVINAHERDPAVCAEGVRIAMDAVARGQLNPSALYTHSFPLEELPRALAALRDRPEGFLKALVTT
ncbi:MAG TPA: zinc-binding dehydrogenase [Myxococcaceae bacterium]|jgi:threonine dehydrogenase-like Zn-dependent dehydrogenase